MVEEGARPVASEECAADHGGGSVCPVYFGASCAFLALHLLSKGRALDLDGARRWRLEEALLQSGARLLGLLVWRAQRGREALEEELGKAEAEVAELKRLRAEDARANEKVVGIFAAHEQSWIADRKKLRLQIQALLAQFQMLEAKREAAMAQSNSMVEEKDRVIRAKEEVLEAAAKRRAELEEQLRTAEAAAEEAREGAKKEAQEHAAELWKHKTAFVELVSSQRQLEADKDRTLRQAEAARRELDEAREQKEEALAAADGLSEDLARTRKDAEQKDKILSAMLRKSKLDIAEKQMLLKELKLARARKKQAELELERLRGLCGGRHRKGCRGLRPLSGDCSDEEQSTSSKLGRAGFHSRTLLLDYLEAESTNESEYATTEDGDAILDGDAIHRCSSRGDEEELVTADIRHLQDWVRAETEKYASMLQQRHYAEVEAFTEQMQLKDEKLEAYRWRLLSMELEAKRLHSHIEGLDGNLSKLGEENVQLEALLVDKERELRALQEQFDLHLQRCRMSVVEKGQELEIPSAEGSQEVEIATRMGGDCDAIDEVKKVQFETQIEKEPNHEGEMGEPELTSSAASPPFSDQLEQRSFLSSPAPVEEIEEEKEVSVDPGHTLPKTRLPAGGGPAAEVINQVRVLGPPSVCENSPWKMDLHALGISYKIKRLKQQLLVLEKLAAAQALKQLPGKYDKRDTNEHKQQVKGFLLVMSLLNKQVKRYQSLEEKADDLCKRMHEIDREGRGRGSCQGRTKEQTGALEGFLEETFQLQRYVVATGQKLTEIQSRIACTFVGGDGGLKDSPEFNLGRFAAIVRGLFREIQRGLEVRIARVIGNLEGTLASDGILHMKNHK